MRSCRPFCCGDAGSIRSGRMPRRSHHTLSAESRPSAMVAKGTPLSVRMRAGSPYSRNSRSKTGRAPVVRVDGRPRHASRARLYPSHTVSG
jgi:hypothetical protein